ncbi:UDP-N-acetylglucosamine 1-carboxyvinyltransferase [Clostridium folliculivorans]|uniref:UDP-N-acetylglucosamine 1-carboxyvinyltransferase n=1 Tax=Clostridium folliculivorans TaxID=2886038 RepID=A0A9W5Y352_9CLOT|nr:UDP-N-acetylglucosamine 1-carboxyvinyltransferase [Clostridium folliculivorans]GKU25869.1 UDP-N-acetylglucosamine 1-carboxyvinyltransferase [Clostridium folliculivorans]GKU27955.1 UDP-N-acetylglucosamine 1-carboxyvinyltransferase [Clostridium folliculivorans]
MERLVINGGYKLRGVVEIAGAKNAAVAILPAAILASEGKSIIDNIPDIEDVHCLERILKGLGCTVNKIDNNTLEIDSSDMNTVEACTADVRAMRASYYFIGAMLSRFKRAKVDLPGGCPIGVRPIDQHIKGFEAMGAEVIIEHGAVNIKADRLVGANIFFDVVSVGATINVMIAATMAEGVTVLENVAKEPHVVDVANFLNSMGADIKGAGTDIIRIRGVESMKGHNYSVIPDQIEAGTFMIAAAATKGDITITNVIPKHLESITAKLLEMGAIIEEGDDSIRVAVDKPLRGVSIKTAPYPGFPTDVQQPMSTLLCVADGRSMITETIWESRLKHLDELKKMGASVKVEGRVAVLEGVSKLTGAIVKATDLRAGAAMVIAGLVAEGKTEICSIEHIDRGYPHIETKFRELGADIYRIQEE